MRQCPYSIHITDCYLAKKHFIIYGNMLYLHNLHTNFVVPEVLFRWILRTDEHSMHNRKVNVALISSMLFDTLRQYVLEIPC